MTRPDGLLLAFLLVTAATVGWIGPSAAAFGLPAAAYLLALADGVFRPQSGLLAPTVVRGPRAGNRVAITFDDGPDPRVTPAILDALRAAGARATFFVIGRAVEAAPALARRIVEEGHELGNHSFAHSRVLNFRGARGMAQEIARGAAALTPFSGLDGVPPLYRPPIGLKNPALARVARRMGLTIVAWSVHGHDTGRRGAPAIAARVLARTRPGDIILLHDGCDRPPRGAAPARAATLEALPEILAGLAARGLAPVTVSELLGRRGVAAVARTEDRLCPPAHRL